LQNSKGAKTLAISNVIGSSITREADYSIYTHAGPEIAVASTKAYTSQVILLNILALYFAEVLENVDLVKEIVKNGTDSKEAIKAVGLEKHMNKFPNQLSGGEQQRVSIARAIAKDPKLLLCDEPTGALDSKTGVDVLKLLKKQCDKNNGANTVIIVTHNSLFAEIADTVIHVKNGKIESVVANENPKKIDEVKW